MTIRSINAPLGCFCETEIIFFVTFHYMCPDNPLTIAFKLAFDIQHYTFIPTSRKQHFNTRKQRKGKKPDKTRFTLCLKSWASICYFYFQYTLLVSHINICTYLNFTADIFALCLQCQYTLNSFIIIYSLCSHSFPENIISLLPYLPHSYKHAEFLILEVCSSLAQPELCLFLFFLVFLGWVFNYLFCFFVFSHLNSTIFFTG